jgi:ABC-type multidrug transport system permease subunit
MNAPLGTLLVSVAAIEFVGGGNGNVDRHGKAIVKDQTHRWSCSALMAMFLFSALGGTWFPLEVSSGAFAAIGKAMPSYWAMNGYQNILIRRLGLESAWMPTLILLAYALGFFVLAVWRFRKMDV